MCLLYESAKTAFTRYEVLDLTKEASSLLIYVYNPCLADRIRDTCLIKTYPTPYSMYLRETVHSSLHFILHVIFAKP